MLPKEWFVPAGVKLAFTQRSGGVSLAPYASLNLGEHVGDDSSHVQQNRAIVKQSLGLSAEPAWLEQVHGTLVVNLDSDDNRTADGSFCRSRNHTCVVMTADCLPVLICDKAGTQVAAIHAGWRGLCDGIIETALSHFAVPADEICVYLGPAIGADAFEVGAEVRERFVQCHQQTSAFFMPRGDKYLGDLQAIARFRIEQAGVKRIFCLPHCTYSLKEQYFSYRRESVTGRMASLIWLEK
ncbi:laccase domain protein [Shewanella colwelliana]|uniref:Purine nucleoside phosphorylase n=1 Tax=Shewanella colwelliana TaxID=23 RepID=A0ABQ4PAY7_SHECO|nr:peptidoglycan editing factor PgeF [Shewanella colwelliana]GIU44619.1 laccase domain protein [Shewanella colwelliana]